MQQLNAYPQTGIDIWLNEPRRAEHSQAPANLLRLWFPESIMAYDSSDNLLWQSTYENTVAPWQYENKAIGDMKTGRKIRKTLARTQNIDDLALLKCIVRWEETETHLALDINNIGPIKWKYFKSSICLQRSASPDYFDEDGYRTFLFTDSGFVASRELIFPPERQLVYIKVGETLPMQNKSKCRLLEGAHFVVSKDERYVLCYAWHEANRIFLNKAPCVRCLHSDLMIHDIEPKTSIQRRGIVFLKEGRLDEALKSYQSWKETAGKSLSVNEL